MLHDRKQKGNGEGSVLAGERREGKQKDGMWVNVVNAHVTLEMTSSWNLTPCEGDVCQRSELHVVVCSAQS